jgi:hypothetical protein
MSNVPSSHWIAGAYYLEWDQLGQLRIAGPDNHLYFGSIGLDQKTTKVSSIETNKGELVLGLDVPGSSFVLVDPAMGHIRKMRALTEPEGGVRPSFEQVGAEHPGALAPNFTLVEGNTITYRRNYDGNYYGVVITVPKEAKLSRDDQVNGFRIDGGERLTLQLKTITGYGHEHPDKTYTGPIFVPGSETKDETAVEMRHLITHNKTSGIDYGTVFPRDWMEAADLGAGDLSNATIAYMYHKAIEHTDGDGEGWHENIVGEYAAERRDEIRELAAALDELIPDVYPVKFSARRYVQAMEDTFIVRNMIDIEPRYVMGLITLSPVEWAEQDLERLRRVAHYIADQAERNQLITFKKLPPKLRRHKQDEYYGAGNWRDSQLAYQVVSPVIAPYDVNVVFYPRALEIMGRYAETLGLDGARIDRLQQKWSMVKEKYRFTNDDGSVAYALALYDVVHDQSGIATYKMLRVNHTDEAYELFYGQPDEEEVASFARRLLDPAYFYTASGPTVVGHGEGYDTTYYHGEVIWTKQTAFVVAGLYRQLERSDANWSETTKGLIRDAALKTAEAGLMAVERLGVVPELHYDLHGVTHLYNDQPQAEGPMNTVQLWSAVGIRRIEHIYGLLKGKKV